MLLLGDFFSLEAKGLVDYDLTARNNPQPSQSGFNYTSTSTITLAKASSAPPKLTTAYARDVPLELHTQGIRETLDCLRGGESSEALLALRRLQTEAEKRARSNRNEADTILRALNIVRGITSWRPEVTQAESGQDLYRDESSSSDEQKIAKQQEEVTAPPAEGNKMNVGTDGTSRSHRTKDKMKNGKTLGDGSGSRPSLRRISSETEGATSLSSRRNFQQETMRDVLPRVPTDGRRESPGSLSTSMMMLAKSPTDTSEGDYRENSARSMRHVLDTYRNPGPSSPSASATSSEYSDEEVNISDFPRPPTALDWHENKQETSPIESPIADSSIEELVAHEEQTNAETGHAGAVEIFGEPASERKPKELDNGNQITLGPGTYSFIQGGKTMTITVRGNDQVQVGCTNPPPISNVDQDILDDDPEPSSATTDGSIDDLLEHYSASSSSSEGDVLTPVDVPLPEILTQGIDLPPFFPNAPNAQGPLAVIRAGLSLPKTATHNEIQDHIACNSTILRYLALHVIPSPDINPVEQLTDLHELVLASQDGKTEYTRLLQAIRSVYWDSGPVIEMLSFIDAFAPPNDLRRRHRILPAFRKIRAADSQRKGCLTSTEIHTLSKHGLSLYDLVSIADLPKVISQGLMDRLIEAAATGVLETLKECDILNEDGALLELLSAVDGRETNQECIGRKKSVVGTPSRLRFCENVDSIEESEKNDSAGEAVRSTWSVSSESSDDGDDEEQYDTQENSSMSDSQLDNYETFFKSIQKTAPSSTDKSLDDQTEAPITNRRPMLARSTGGFRAIDATSVSVDEATKKSPELSRFFEEIGTNPVVIDTDTVSNQFLHPFLQDALSHDGTAQKLSLHPFLQGTDDISQDLTTYWGVNLGGILDA
ncbi:hypothetical protein CGCS363_v000978 [Colletotrichum siamense]|uniref:uncharacterized protein n=1 Tax=Colletotrichum siamense TaxID=690259 RepID=UPI0018731F45|nr:uncharacterized protein CGCS363_v000978 [Colletotrichum siamense]KAF5515626.1 hypothetical protein CGCS363_v000978 [Colletotrichum siamense]